MNAKVRFIPDNVTITVRQGTTLLRAAQQAGVHIRTRCGGQAACLMCKVKVPVSHSCSKPEMKEIRKLGNLMDRQHRLACQAKAVSPEVIVEIPEDPLKAAIRKQLSAQQEDELW